MGATLKKRGGFARIKAQIGNRLSKPRDSIEYGWQTLELMITYWRHIESHEDRWFETLQEIFDLRLWEKLPPDKPYGSPKALLEEELEIGLDEILSQIEEEDHRRFIKKACEKMDKAPITTSQENCNRIQNITPLTPSSHFNSSPQDIQNKLDILKKSADISDWGYGRWAYEKWEEFNARYWQSKLDPGMIFWGLTPHGHDLGYYERSRNAIMLHISLIKPSGNAWRMSKLLGERFAEDVLLHEMIHQALYQLQGKNGGEPHNCQFWCDEINRLASLLSIDTKGLTAAPVKQRRVNGKVTWLPRPGYMNRRQLSGFPHSLRPKEYYEQATWDLLDQIKK